MPAEQINTEDTVMAEVNQPATATSSLDEDAICDYCHVRMATVKQMTLNDTLHEVRVCTADPKHTKTVLIG